VLSLFFVRHSQTGEACRLGCGFRIDGFVFFLSCLLSCKYVILPGHEGRKDVPVLLLVLVSVFQRALFLPNGGGRMPSESPAGGSPSRLRVQRYGDFFILPNIMTTFFSLRAKKVNGNE